MKRGERGFTLIEVLVTIAIVALISAAATMSTFQVLNVTRRSNDHMVVIRQVQNAGYWISRDALMAQSIVTDGLETDEFLILKWTEWGYDGDSVYHEVIYSIDLSDEIRKIRRAHLINGVPSEQTLVAEYIYYTGESDATWVTYDAPMLTVQIVASFGEASETREYRVLPRPDF